MFGGVMPLPFAVAQAGRQGRQVRSFRTNSGTTDYVQLASAVTLAGDFEVEWVGQVPATGGFVFCNYDSPLNRFVFNSTSGGIILQLSAGQVANITISGIADTWGDGKLHRFSLSRTGTTLTLTVDGVGYSVGNSSASFIIDRFMSKWSAATSIPNYTGVMSDVKITSAGTLIHHWPMNEGSGSTHVDVIGGNNGTIINGTAGDWELFEKVPGSGEWVGRQLSSRSSVENPPDYQSGVSPVIKYWDIFPAVAGYKYRLSAYLQQEVGTSGWSSQGGLPSSTQWRTVSGGPVNVVIGGDIIPTSSVNIRLFNTDGIARFVNIIARRILEIA